MRIDRFLLLGVIALSVISVSLVAGTLLWGLVRVDRSNRDGLKAVTESIDAQNNKVFEKLNQQAGDVGQNIWNATETSAREQLRNVGNETANRIKGMMDVPFATIRAVADTLLFIRGHAENDGSVPSRAEAESYLRDFLQRNSYARGIFCGWEPNAFDGRDADFIGKENPDPEMILANPNYVSEGAFIPWFYRDAEKVIRGFLDDYLISDAQYYTGARDSRREFITEPYVDGDITVISFCVPLMNNDTLLGAAGFDIDMNAPREFVANCKPFGTGFAMLVSHGGAIVYHPDERINFTKEKNKMGEEETVYRQLEDVAGLELVSKHIKSGEPAVYTCDTIATGERGTEMFVLHVPFQIGNYPEKWTVVIAAPVADVMRSRDTAKSNVDAMVTEIATQHSEFRKSLEADTNSVATKATNEFRQILTIVLVLGGGVLLVSIVVGALFARRVNRTVSARDFWYRQILDSSGDVLTVTDLNGHVMFINKRGLEFLKKTLAECVGKDAVSLWRATIGDVYESCGLPLFLSCGENASSLQAGGCDWDVRAAYLVNSAGQRDSMIERFCDVSDREYALQLVDKIESITEVTVSQAESIASVSERLSRGANEQASGMQSITSGMQEVNAQTVQSAASAEQANTLARDAATAARDGQKRMDAMVASMHQISENARSTQNVIKTIDDIAFQTNLLALNAAVEAARAGQMGKGFAVVAEEVRRLASRSAHAASETQELIAKSNAQIDGGVRVANETASALSAIAQHVTEVSALISDITSLSREQNSNVGRMTQTLQTVEGITQQNLGLASTTSDAVQQLSTQVSQLQELLQRFHDKSTK
ncbi:MAG: methyl-accepting chemotaxis protein [Thermoguttaceae bacterium]